MMRLRSLRVRIAATVFVLELIMLTLVLSQTQSLAYEQARSQIDLQDRTIVQLLGEVSHTALLTTEFSEVSPLFEESTGNPHIMQIRLYDRRERVIASSDIKLLGLHMDSEVSGDESYWQRQVIEGSTSTLGHLHIQFSNRELATAYQQTLTLGIWIAGIGMLLILVAGLALGHVLTRRLHGVITTTRSFASGNQDARCDVSGNDEITELGHAFNHMAEQIGTSFARIQHLAYHDALTGLANRIDFDKRLEQATHSAQDGQHTHALLYIDLDQFKIVNDTCGHDAGDQLLVELAQTLSLKLRARDTIARLGGDEFGILLEHCTLEEARQIAEKLREAVETFRFAWQGRTFRLGISIGVVLVDKHAESGKQLLSLADMACYSAKDMGRNAVRVATHDDDDIQSRASEMQWVSRIQDAMEHQQFTLLSQSIAVTSSAEQRPFREFLLRLKDHNGELIPPGRFLPSAERYGLMPAIDRHVFSLVTEHLAGLPEERRPALSFINLSGASLDDGKLFEHIETCLQNTQLPAKRFCFEITETTAVNNYHQAMRFIEKVRSLGCLFALDDFGSGMCSFTYLKSLPVDFVKIDGSFIRNLQSNNVDRSIVVAINQIAHDAGFETIAEFVEDEVTLGLLQDLLVDYAQGYFIDIPKPVDAALQAAG